MKRLLIASVVAAQLSSTPVFAASLEDYSSATHARGGAFAGARVRVAFGGADHGKPRAGLTLAPVNRSGEPDRLTALRFAEGLEFGFKGDQPARLTIAGQPLEKRRLGAQGGEAGEEDDDGGIPTWALVVGGVVIAAGIGLAVFIDAVRDSSE